MKNAAQKARNNATAVSVESAASTSVRREGSPRLVAWTAVTAGASGMPAKIASGPAVSSGTTAGRTRHAASDGGWRPSIHMRTCVRALGQPEDRGRGAARAARLPREAIVRHFDAPEALDTRFYEVRAKSALNRVPEASHMPFRWTINPYRGCTHACAYCLEGDTPILMADGRHAGRSPTCASATPSTARRGAAPYRRYVHDRGARPLVDDQAGVSGHARGRHRADHERRPPLPDRPWLEARDRRAAGAGAAPASDPRTTSCSDGRLRRDPPHGRDYRRGYLCGIDPRRRARRRVLYDAPGARAVRAPRSASRSPTSRRFDAPALPRARRSSRRDGSSSPQATGAHRRCGRSGRQRERRRRARSAS